MDEMNLDASHNMVSRYYEMGRKNAKLICMVKGLPHTKEEMIRWFMKRMDNVPEGAQMEMDLELIYFDEGKKPADSINSKFHGAWNETD
jgi:hypothetical protein